MRRGSAWRRWAYGLAAVALTAVVPASSWGAEVRLRAAAHPDYGRLVFDWPRKVSFQTSVRDGKLVLVFGDAFQGRLEPVLGALGAYVSGGRVTGDGKTVEFDLKRPVTANGFYNGNSIAIDLRPAKGDPAASATPAKPAEPPPQTRPPQTPSPTETAAKPPPPAAKASAPAPSPAVVTGAASVASASAATVPPASPPPPGAPGEAAPATATGAPSAPADANAPPPAAVAAPAPAAPPAAVAPAPAAPVEGPALTFDPGGPSSLAVFPRAGRLYLVFDRPMAIGAGKVSGKVNEAIGPIEPVPATGGTVFRTRVGPFVWPSVTRQGTAWRVAPSTRLAAPADSLRIDAEPDFLLGGRLVIRSQDAATVVQFTDPEVGDRILAVPLPNPGQAVADGRVFPDAELIPTFQGVAVRPAGDDVTVRPVREGVEISAAGGLHLAPRTDIAMATGNAAPQSPPASRANAAAPAGEGGHGAPAPAAGGHGAAPAAPPAGGGRRLLNFPEWQHGGMEHYTDARQELQQAVADAPEDQRPKAALDLAKFYVANGFGQEAAGVLKVLEESGLDLGGWPEYRAVRGVARYLSGDLAGAEEDFSQPNLAQNPDIVPWRAAIAADRQDWPAAAKGFKTGAAQIANYPEPMQTRMSLKAAEASLQTGDPSMAQRLIDRVLSHAGEEAGERPDLQFALGQIYRVNEDTDRAIEQFQKAYDSTDRYYHTRAGLQLVDLKMASGQMSPAAAVDLLTGLTYAWRGDGLEIDVRRRLGEAQIAGGNYADGFNTMKETAAILGDTPLAEKITAAMQDSFAGLFKDGAAKLPTMDALKLYDEFRELTPLGERGDSMIRALAERLAAIDLLSRAADLYEHQVKYRLSGPEKATAGTRLAAIRLLDDKPEAAIQALQDSNIAGLPPELAQQRNTMYAKALAELGRTEEALQLLAKDDSRGADLLRVDIAWRKQKWDDASTALAKVIGPPPPAGKGLDPATSQLVLNRAVTLALSGDATGLSMLRKDFGPAMTSGPDADTFQVLTRPDQATGLIDVKTIRSRVAEVDVFKSFLKGFQGGKPAEAPKPPASSS